ncbi:MAG: hypothetical protein GY719_22930 [bacterium]|nr:hypothetical protein [bacterium]
MTAGADLERAFGLAVFLHRDREVAFHVALEAVARLEVTAQGQDRRRRYQPAGRRRPGGSRLPASRYRVTLDRAQLLQLLVYVASEAHERCQEQAPPEERPTTGEMTVRFIAYLARICLRRNAFHAALGVGRVLHDYSTEEVMALYDLVLQDPDRYPAGDYLRERKRVLLKELRERFAGFVETCRGARGEERFEPQPASPALTARVRRTLEACTPWQSRCAVPERFDPLVEELPELRFAGRDPDGEHPVEVRRIHALMHPPCLERLARSLELEPPEERLTVPRFFAVRGEDGVGRNDDPPELGDDALAAAADDLSRRASRRRHAAGDRLSVRVDGTEALRWDLARHSRVRLEVGEETERVEVWALDAQEGDVLLALFLPGVAGAGSVRLEARQSIRFRVEAEAGADGARNLAVEVSYREGSLARAVSLWARRLRRRLGAGGFFAGRRGAFAGAAAVVLLVAGGLLLPPGGRELWDVVRGPAPPAATPLAEIERVFVEPLGEAPFHRRLRAGLVAGLEARPGWQVTAPARPAQAVLRLADDGEGAAGRAEPVVLQLVNRRGEVLFEQRFEGGPEEVAERAVHALDAARTRARL